MKTGKKLVVRAVHSCGKSARLRVVTAALSALLS